tara:strand:- start:2 stop:427 length:426 start_codon:yes stop_codon:yes gene_type:complete
MKLKKPIEIIYRPIEVHGAICSIANTIEDGVKSVEWVRASKNQDGFWKESEITIDKILSHSIDHLSLTDAEKINEGIIAYEWMAKEVRIDKTPSHIDLIKFTEDKFDKLFKDEDEKKIKDSETKLQKMKKWIKYILTEKTY